MKKLIMFSPPSFFVICMVLLCACHESDNEQILDQLDQVIESKGLYAVRFERRVDSLRRELCTASDDTMRWRTANRLFDSYITYNIDTAARYVALMYDLAEHTGRRDMKFLSTTCDISVLIGRNNIEDAYDRIRSLDTAGITKRMRANYYTQQMVVYGRLASQNTSESRKGAYADTLARIRRVRIGFDGHSYVTRQRLRAIDLLSQQRCDEALDVFAAALQPPAEFADTGPRGVQHSQRIRNPRRPRAAQILARPRRGERPANPRPGVPLPVRTGADDVRGEGHGACGPLHSVHGRRYAFVQLQHAHLPFEPGRDDHQSGRGLQHQLPQPHPDGHGQRFPASAGDHSPACCSTRSASTGG